MAMIIMALLSIQDGHGYYDRTFFDFLLLLYFKSKWAQILNAPAWQLLVLLIIQTFLWNCCQPIYTDYENKLKKKKKTWAGMIFGWYSFK